MKASLDDSEKKVYEVKEIQEMLGISRNGAYDFVKRAYKDGKPFRVIKIGGNYRIPKISFDTWLERDNG
ncbi:MAG: helix-turn-helix domain-containing protein [Clostridiaceae bacterium]|nr:helix-turn-helix domain-containing protein [Clostridiaceae bacterium]